MRAVRLHGVGDLRQHDEELPAAAQALTLVRVGAIGICGSDLHWFTEGSIGDAHVARPLVLGHEIAGVAEGGPLDGRLVAVDPAVPCGRCSTCSAGLGHLCPDVVFAGHGEQDGGLQEVISWPTQLLYPLPSTMTAEDGAMLEPLGVALHAHDLGHVRAGAKVAVLGLGPIGLMLVQLLVALGAGHVVAVDPLPHRRRAALDRGADEAVGPDALAEGAALPAPGVDVAFEVAGTDEAVHGAFLAARPGGRVVLVGIPEGDSTTFRASLARRKGLTILMSRRMAEVYPRAIRLVEQGSVDVRSVVTERFGLDEAGAAFDAAVSRRGLKVVVRP